MTSSALGQFDPDNPSDASREPLFRRKLDSLLNRTTGDSPQGPRDPRVRLFRMPSAFPTDPVGLDSDSDATTSDADPLSDRDSWDGRLRVAMGADNPFFDFRRPSDPGGVGYYKLHSQLLLFDTQKTGLSMGLQAVTPAGMEAEGLPDGPTILSPNFALFYEVGKGAAIQGFVGKNVRANSRWSEGLERDIQYGVALQSPLPGVETKNNRAVHFFLEALGRYRSEADPNLRNPANWELLPGLHWQMGENWWMSGGVLMPLAPARLDSHLWQITCSWQF
jgi:hypothetical protein